MKKLIVILFLLNSLQIFGQSEFTTYKNGLIYNDATMNKLERIVDSLNLKYKTCDLSKVYYSKSQTIGNYLELETDNIKQAIIEINKKPTFESFISKFPNAKVEKNILIVKFKYINYEDKEIVEFSQINLNDNYGFEIDRESNFYEKDLKNSWLYEFTENKDSITGRIYAFYFPDHFKSIPLSQNYNRQIGYSECLIDTNATKILSNSKEGWIDMPNDWQSLNIKKKNALLTKLRSIHVTGGCSQDRRPREHAINIALLSAETANWEVFLKSHLDIMNDRFARVSDGSYAWAKRKTYIRELEELEINVPDLILGISLRIENPAKNHYFGNLGRLGRAITESQNKVQFESQILHMIEDNELDIYNRVLAYFLFRSYTNYIEEETERKRKVEDLKFSIATLPDYIKDKIDLKEK